MNNIRIMKASENPLSADVIILETKGKNWIYDVGCNDQSFEELQRLPNKNIVISHFHPDHMGNLGRLDCEHLYVGKNTFKYTKKGIVVEEALEVDEEIQIFPMPSSHAKGSLAMKIRNEYLLVGDAFYPQHKGGKGAYNVQLLHEQICLLEQVDVELIGVSHKEDFFQGKDKVLAELKALYEKRVKNEPFIYDF